MNKPTKNILNITDPTFVEGEVIGGSIERAPSFTEETDEHGMTFLRRRFKSIDVYTEEGFLYTLEDATVMVKGYDVTTPSDGSGLTQAQRDRIDSFGKTKA